MKFQRTALENAMSAMIDTTGYTDLIWNVAEFDNTFNSVADMELKIDMLEEEVKEFYTELWELGNTPNLLKEYGDILYVLEGTLAIIDEDEFEVEDEFKAASLEFCINSIMDIAKRYRSLWTNQQINKATHIIHESNMSKLTIDGKVLRREDGKVLKSDQYVAPDMKGLF